jgi:hypothetical protein
MQLSALENSFRDGVLAADEHVLSAIDPGNLSAQKRLNIYRNNVVSNYRSALEAVYPAILSLVGPDYFRQAAQRYVKQFPSRSGDIHHYGEQFAELLASLPGAEDLAYLPDVARLEWSIHAAFHAANAERLDLSRLQGIAPEHYANILFKLNPAARLLESPFPIQRIWHVNLPDYQGDQQVDLSEGGGAVLVMRRNFVMEVENISATEVSMLNAFADANLFGDALERTLAIDPSFDGATFLQRVVANETIVDFTL